MRLIWMTYSIPPTPLSLRRRINLLTARLFAFVATVLNWLRPLPKAPGEIVEYAYGQDPAQTLQYIAPNPDVPLRAPLVYIHGGGWIIMKNRLYTRELIDFANRGYPVFNLEYPLAPDNPHPGILLSLFSALKWIRKRHPEVDGVHVMGDSAGGNLAAMLAVLSANPNLLRGLGPGAPLEAPVSIRSAVALYGVHDRLSWLETGFPGAELMLECYAGRIAFEPTVPPDKAITPMDLEFDAYPPMFLITGAKDRLGESTKILGERLERMPGVSAYKVYEGEMHGFFNMPWRPGYAELRSDILEFLEAHDAVPGRAQEPQLAEASV